MRVTRHIGIAGPIATRDVAHLLDHSRDPSPDPAPTLPHGYDGAPLLATLITELLRRGHRVSAFTLSRDLPLDDNSASTVLAHGPNFTLYCVPMRPRAWPFNGRRVGRIVDLYAFERRGLQRAIALAAPDLVHAHWAYEFAWAALRSGLPHVITCHDSPFLIARYQRDFRHGGYRWLRAAMAWQVLRQARHVTTVSPYMVGQISALCRVPVRVVPNPIGAAAGVVSGIDKGPRLRVAMPGRRRVVMAANGWDVRKNSVVALRAFALLAQQLPGVELRAFGHDHGPGEAAQRWWQASGLSGDVRFVGAVPQAQMLAELADSDVFLHTALEESFGAVLAEAMAAGVPVVAGAASGAVPWVVGDAGRLVDVTRPDAVAQALEGLLLSRDETERAGQIGRQRVRSLFSAEVVVSAYERAYEYAWASAALGVGVGGRP